MPDLTITRHDLPPRWDGWPVTWEGWGWFTGFVCIQTRDTQPRTDVCHRCGHVGEQPMNRGRAQAEPFNGRRLLLIAFRCPRCRHDTIHTAGQWWDLEPADYLDAGSVPP